MARLITAKMTAMLNYRPGQLCPLDNQPINVPHAGRADLMHINGAWHVVHAHHRGIFHGVPQPDPALWPTW